jgi:hypothetical protein
MTARILDTAREVMSEEGGDALVQGALKDLLILF